MSQRLRADLLLLAATLMWGSTFVAQRAGNEQVSPFTFNTARFALGSLILLPVVAARQVRAKTPWPRRNRTLWLDGALLGVLLFGGMSLQQVGLVQTTAGKAGFITSLYVVIVPLFLALFWRKRIRWQHWAGVALATVGLFLLSVRLQEAGKLNPGDGWVLLGALAWALHIIAIGRLAPGRDPVQLALLQYIVCAALSLIPALAWGRDTWDSVRQAAPSILYAAVFSTCLAFTIQIAAQRHAPPADAAILMSMESVFAAFFGWLLLGETLSGWQIVGCGLMLAGILMAQSKAFVHSPAHPD